ncbi:unnamed protein product [Cladocopium goreaui]|uniref:Fluoride-specific ion channel FluC 2 n=1 Tax=Cladocopium goreaui TaxID=2562237 RepID=A0A9P1DHG6_9DINO|nr:unnamed protein product [Cladocopium goreaui]
MAAHWPIPGTGIACGRGSPCVWGIRTVRTSHGGRCILPALPASACGVLAASLRSRRATPRRRCRALPEALLACVGGGIGATCRFGISRLGAARGWSVWGTMMTNFLGCGLLAISNIIKLTQQQRILLGTGFCGGFTTFSTFAVEAVQLMRTELGRWKPPNSTATASKLHRVTGFCWP